METAARPVLAKRARGKVGVGAGSLEELCGRAALLAGEVESNAGPGLGLGLDAGVTDGFGKDEGGSVEGQVTVPDWRDNRREGGASLRDGGEAKSGAGRFPQLRHAGAVVGAISLAACRQIFVGAGCEGQYRRDQRKAEEEEQDDAEDATHNVIVASFAGSCVKGMFVTGDL